ncbi:MAG: Sec-independent protein translocase subunit TatA [Moraxella sp.]|nr:Sec-independent protein translocase subunit TatA [Moraxella sp.]
MGSFSLTHWLIFLAVVVVIFGTSKLKNAGKDIGHAVKGFKDAVKDETAAITEVKATPVNDPDKAPITKRDDSEQA